jgi:anti-sigma B factor antagonist
MTNTIDSNTGPNSVRYTQGPDGPNIGLVGEIDISSWSELDQVYTAVTSDPPGPVTVDLSEASFVDSTTLGFLIRLHNHVSRAGHLMVIDSPSPTVVRAIEVCGLDQVLNIRSTETG